METFVQDGKEENKELGIAKPRTLKDDVYTVVQPFENDDGKKERK